MRQPGQGGLAVSASRREPHDSLDFFPTIPWATRALLGWVSVRDKTVIEPACGDGHISRVLEEDRPAAVFSSDIFDYGFGEVHDFLYPSFGLRADWVVTNPPFRLAGQFTLKALDLAEEGVALLVRTQWLEGKGRFFEIFQPYPPSTIVQFADRINLVKGAVDPKATRPTAYCWVIWRRPYSGPTFFEWVPPGARAALERAEDYL